MPDRKSSKHDVDILENYNFTNKVDADVKPEVDPFKRDLPDSTIIYKDLTEKHEDFVPKEQHLQDPQFKDKIEKIKVIFKNLMIINLMEKDLSLKMLLKIIEISLEIKIQGIKFIKTFR